MGISMLREQASGLTRDQRNAFLAAWLGWAMDAFDYFLLVFVITDVAKEFDTSKTHVAVATTLTLAARPVGALLFGYWADKVGRRTPLLVCVLFYSTVGLLTAFSPSLTALLVLRTLYGIGMGGEWGLGASLAMEKIPVEKRGFYSGVLQQGYPVGYFMAALAFFIVTPTFGWRGLFVAAAVPAALALFIRLRVGESEVWEQTAERRRQTQVSPREVFLRPAILKRFLYLVLLMGAFNFMSHGTQDFFPTFLEDDFGAGHTTTVVIALIYNAGAILGGMYFGALSERFGRKRTIILLRRRRAPDRAAVRLRADAGHHHARRLPHAGLRPGRLGRDPRPPHGALARRDPRVLPRRDLPAGQRPGGREPPHPDVAGRQPQRVVRARGGDRPGPAGGDPADRARVGGARRALRHR